MAHQDLPASGDGHGPPRRRRRAPAPGEPSYGGRRDEPPHGDPRYRDAPAGDSHYARQRDERYDERYEAPYGGPPHPPEPPYPSRPPYEAEEPEPEPDLVPTTSKAGRNIPMAIGVGLALGAVVLASLLIYREAFLVVVAAAVGIGIWELVRALSSRHKVPLVPLLAGGVGMTAMAWFGGAESLVLGLGLTMVVVTAWRLADGPVGYLGDMLAATLVAVYVPFLAGFAVLLAVPEDGPARIIVVLGLVVLSDTGGFIAGVLFGKHPMSPKVSPKKSWEGMGGSIVACALGGALMLFFVFDVSWWKGALFGLAITIAATVGDLTESMIKRDLGVKDMSSLIPGHGGLMDRLDSILLAAPTAVVLLSVLAPPA
ncbi:phosphatidate cytidylyltransferase [Phytomonospora sp. NPDC050363]|uniref:phosphatidate cytidylyltransferase n=1 Tax=Phytomonospora sp. NPDC050363 TaxID=3155642 RepID=UPI0033D82D6E